MQRYFVEKKQLRNNEVTITGEDAKHIGRVMRMNVGDEIICSTNDSNVTVCEITAISHEVIQAKVVRPVQALNELPVAVTIAQGLPKGDKLELIVQKGTELGAQAFIPVALTRSVVKWDKKKEDKKLERLEKIAKEAAEQSHRAFIPKIKESCTLTELIKISDDFTKKIIAYEEQAKTGEHSALTKVLRTIKHDDSLLVVIGPEGGLTDEEVIKLEEHGFIRTSFGPRILRTETAAMYLLSAVSYHTELMG